MNQEMLTPTSIREEASGWVHYLNEVVGVLCFTLRVSALGTGNPPLYGALSFVFVMLFHIPNFKKKAHILNYLRSKKERTELEELALKDYLSQLKFHKLLLSIFGYVFLFFVATSWFVFEDHLEIIEFIYGNA